MITDRIKEWKYLEKQCKDVSVQRLKLDKLFDVKGEYGVAGKFKLSCEKDEKRKIIAFKMVNDIDFQIDNESKNMERINSLNCPYFVRFLSTTDLPISKCFMMDQDLKIFISETKNGINYEDRVDNPTILMENVETIGSLYAVLTDFKLDKKNKKYSSDDRNKINSLILQTLMSFEIGQRQVSFVHYDPHPDNILCSKCESDSFILYNYKGVDKICQLLPTFGVYPVIIDFGMSYTDRDRSHVDSLFSNYQSGRQSEIFDKLNDVHHFLLSCFRHLKKDYLYDMFDKKTRKIFSPLNLEETKDSKTIKFSDIGDKKLPIDLMDFYKNKMDDLDFPENLSYYYSDVLHLINGLTRYPLKRYKGYTKNTDFSPHFEDFLEAADKFFSEKSKNRTLEIFRILIRSARRYSNIAMLESIYKNKSKKEDSNAPRSMDDEASTKIKLDFCKRKHGENLETTITDLNKYTKMERSVIKKSISVIWTNGDKIGKHLSSMYSDLVDNHLTIIESVYNKISMSSPFDFFKMLYMNMNLVNIMKIDTIIYIFSREGVKKMIAGKVLTEKQIRLINACPSLKKGILLASFLEK